MLEPVDRSLKVERRKLSPLDEYIIAISEPPEFENKRTQFYNSLRHFYRKKWGCPLKVPSIQGVEVDLYKLYETVVSYGGWQKVTNSERWSDVLRDMSLNEDAQVADYGLKMMYMRFLSKFEQNELGNDVDEHENDMLGRTRLKNLNTNLNTESPISMPKQNNFNDNNEPEYRKILKSLLSGLPNEVDFAMNICTLLSHPGPYLLRLNDCPQLSTILVAHCGIFDDGETSLSELFFDSWQNQSKHDFCMFWRNAGIREVDILALLPSVSGSEGTKEQSTKAITSSYSTLFCNSDGRLDLKEVTNWRVFQVLSVLRNLSFEECNKAPMANNLPLLKFLLACCYSKYQALISSAFDTLSNIASEIDLNTEGSVFENYLLLKMISKGLFSTDKFEILRSLEIFTGLCNSKNNESLICDFVDEKVLSRIFTLITAKDILLCIFTLETIYQMTEMGRPSCEVLSRHDHSIDILVDLATSDAASFGVSGLAGIKVVEIHGVTGQLQPYHPPQKTSVSNNGSVNNIPTTTTSSKTFGSPAVYSDKILYSNGTSVTSGTASAAKSLPPPSLYNQYQTAGLPPPPTLTTVPVRPMPSLPPSTPTFQYITATPTANPFSSAINNGNNSNSNSNMSVKDSLYSSDPLLSSVSRPRGSSKKFSTSRSSKSRNAVKNLSSALSIAIDRSPPQAVQDVVAAIASSTFQSNKDNNDSSTSTTVSSNGESRLEHLTKSWIHDHCVLEANSIANRGDMYACYVDHVRTEYGILACSMQMFINQLKTIFPSIIITHSPGSSIHAVEGLKFLKDGKKSWVKSEASNVAAQHPLMQRMLSSPSASITGTTTASELSNNCSSTNSVNGTLEGNDSAFSFAENKSNINTTSTIELPKGEKLLENSEDESQLSKKTQKISDYNGGSLLCNGTVNNFEKDPEENSLPKNNNAKSNVNLNETFSDCNSIDTMNSISQNNGILMEAEPLSNSNCELETGRTTKSEDVREHQQVSTNFEPKHEIMEQSSNGDEPKKSDGLLMPSLIPLNSNITSESTYQINDLDNKDQLNGLALSSKRKRPSSNGLPKNFGKKPRTTGKNSTSNVNGNAYGTDGQFSSDSVLLENQLNGSVSHALMNNPSNVVSTQKIVYDTAVPSTSAAPCEFMCEWDCCGRFFTSAKGILYHNANDHLQKINECSPVYLNDFEKTRVKTGMSFFICKWPACDTTPRSKWSMVSHLQDHHCTDSALQYAYRKRIEMGHINYISFIKQRIEKPKEQESTIQSLSAHSYSRFAAVDAIKRHAFSFLPKDITEDPEGPVTKSLRLTSCLILRNIAKHSVEGRRKIRKHESHLSWMALSKMESSAALAQCLGELAAHSLLSSTETSSLPDFLRLPKEVSNGEENTGNGK